MILDGLLLFSQAQAITTTADSTNVVDLVNPRDLGVGDDPAMKVMVQVITALTGGTSLQVLFQGSVDNSAYTTYAESDAILAADLTAGATLFPIHLPRRRVGAARPRYYKLRYVVAGTFAAGTLTAGLVLDHQAWEAYPAGLTINN